MARPPSFDARPLSPDKFWLLSSETPAHLIILNLHYLSTTLLLYLVSSILIVFTLGKLLRVSRYFFDLSVLLLLTLWHLIFKMFRVLWDLLRIEFYACIKFYIIVDIFIILVCSFLKGRTLVRVGLCCAVPHHVFFFLYCLSKLWWKLCK